MGEKSQVSQKERPPIVGYILCLETLRTGGGREGKFKRWIEYVAIAYRIESPSKISIINPMGGRLVMRGPYIICANRKEMNAKKRELNRQIVAEHEPWNWAAWGITGQEPTAKKVVKA